jgi:hypothetical protein
LISPNPFAQVVVFLFNVKESSDKLTDVRRGFYQEAGFMEAIAVSSSRVSIPDQIFGKRGIGASKLGNESAVEGLDSSHTIQIGVFESRHSQLQIPCPGLLSRVLRKVS